MCVKKAISSQNAMSAGKKKHTCFFFWPYAKKKKVKILAEKLDKCHK